MRYKQTAIGVAWAVPQPFLTGQGQPPSLLLAAAAAVLLVLTGGFVYFQRMEAIIADVA